MGDFMADTQETENSHSENEVLQEERYLWMARAFSLIALLAFIANILMLMALSGLMPLVRVQPFYLQTQDKERQTISVIRPDFSSMSDDDIKIIQEALVREYLLARYGVSSDTSEVQKRWSIDGIVYAMSESSVYDTFLKQEMVPTLAEAKNGLTRNVRINWVNRGEHYPNGVSVWNAEIELTDMSPTITNPKIRKWAIQMEVSFQPKHKVGTWSQRLKNPLGFVVSNFGGKASKEQL